ncbi:hypothetical protein [Micromonospora sp. URMC 103]|uniref:hypothetical protein n=1 Tax=Micromonospora sp. URMC 103 TaxID=3423406 RepID=UPI003F1A2486
MQQTKRTSTRPARLNRTATLAGAFINIGVLLGAFVSLLASAACDAGSSAGDPSNQFAYQATVQNDRLDLFKGRMYVTTDRRVKVTEWFDVRVLLCGPANTDDLCLSPAGVPPTDPDTSRDVPLGGRVGVTLAAADNAVEVKSLVAPEDDTQPLTDPSDAGMWVWDVRATKPGNYTLRVSVFILAAETKAELMPRETAAIQLKVERTGTYTAKQTAWSLIDVAKWGIPHIVAIVSALAAAGAAAELFRRRGRRRRQAEEQGFPPGDPHLDAADHSTSDAGQQGVSRGGGPAAE